MSDKETASYTSLIQSHSKKIDEVLNKYEEKK